MRERELKGLPIGNLTSQIFANIYLDQLDQFVKHTLRVTHYFRYADDFIIVHDDPVYLLDIVRSIAGFLKDVLALELHPQKVEIRKLRQGIDFLGYVILPHHIVLRTKTKKRMLKKLSEKNLPSYLGLLQHCNGYRLSTDIKHGFPPSRE